MNIINIKDICGKKTVTRADGAKIGKMLKDKWNSENTINIDFSNVLVASVSFMDEAFGKLALSHSKEDLQKKLKFKNMVKYDKALLNDILYSRFRQKDLDETAQKTDINIHPPKISSGSKEQESIPMDNITSLSFSDIRKTIEKALPLQRKDIRKHFIGIKVVWDSYLSSASKEANEIVFLRLAPGPDLFDRLSSISCKVSLNDYPELTIMPEGAKIRIHGEISSANSYEIELINVKLSFTE